MALSTYAELQASVLGWLKRKDLADQVPDFIRLAEAKFNRRLRVNDMRTTVTLTSPFTLPDDFESVDSVFSVSDPTKPLSKLTVESMRRAYSNTSGTARAYAVDGTTLLVRPAGDVTLNYYQSIPALSDTNTSNWLLAGHPDIYLYGACMEAAPYLEDDQRLGTWSNLLGQALTDLEAADKRLRYSGAGHRRNDNA